MASALKPWKTGICFWRAIVGNFFHPERQIIYKEMKSEVWIGANKETSRNEIAYQHMWKSYGQRFQAVFYELKSTKA